jgi:hypothetical protein
LNGPKEAGRDLKPSDNLLTDQLSKSSIDAGTTLPLLNRLISQPLIAPFNPCQRLEPFQTVS